MIFTRDKKIYTLKLFLWEHDLRTWLKMTAEKFEFSQHRKYRVVYFKIISQMDFQNIL
jgi:hypothetical protein